jgi:hypothetical protein
MTDYYRKIYLSDVVEENLVNRVNEIIKQISPGNLTEIEFNPIIQQEVSVKDFVEYYDGNIPIKKEKTTKTYVVKYTCLITELVEEKTSWIRK